MTKNQRENKFSRNHMELNLSAASMI